MKNILFTEYNLKDLRIKNRLVRSATHNGTSAERGFPSGRTKEILTLLADEQVGLIFTAACLVVDGAHYYSMASDDHIDAWSEITKSIEGAGSVLAMQLMHPGRQSHPEIHLIPRVGPSAVPVNADSPIPKKLTIIEIKSIISAFAEACGRAKNAGFDAVQLHLAHGYLLDTFLSPQANIRNDDYGGNTLKRSRIVVEIIEEARKLVGDDYPILAKMNFNDYIDGGITTDEACKVAKIITGAGIDGIEISAGTLADDPNRICPRPKNEEEESCFREYAVELKKNVNVPVILVGCHRTPEIMADIIETGDADLLSMSRPFIREPDLVSRWEKGNLTKAACISCNGCLRLIMEGKQVRCVVIDK